MLSHGQAQTRQWPITITGTLVGLFILLLCYWSGRWSLVPPLRLWAINRVDKAEGRVDLVAPAGLAAGGGWLAPDSRHMVIGWDDQMVIWNMVTDERRPLSVSLNSMGWLNEQQFVVRDDLHYHIVEAATGAVTTVLEVPPETYLKPDGFAVIAPLLQRAEVIYSTQGWGGLYRLFVYADNQWSTVVLNAYEFGLASNAEVEALLATVAHQPIVRPGHETPAQAAPRLTSPDGQYRARKVDVGDQAYAVITTPDGTKVARVAKEGWYPVILG